MGNHFSVSFCEKTFPKMKHVKFHLHCFSCREERQLVQVQVGICLGNGLAVLSSVAARTRGRRGKEMAGGQREVWGKPAFSMLGMANLGARKTPEGSQATAILWEPDGERLPAEVEIQKVRGEETTGKGQAGEHLSCQHAVHCGDLNAFPQRAHTCGLLGTCHTENSDSWKMHLARRRFF